MLGSLALDSLGHPHFAQPVWDPGTIRHRWFDGSEWHTEDLYDSTDLPFGTQDRPQAATIALDAHDRPSILFMDQIDGPSDAQAFVVYAYHDGSEWRGLLLSSKPTSAWWTGLRVAPDGGAVGTYGREINERGTATRVRVTLPDLTGEWASLSLTEQDGKSRVAGVLSVRNDGMGRSKSARIALYLSRDAELDGGDVPLTSHKSTGGLAPGKSKNIAISFTVPGSLAGLHLIAVIDPDARLEDLDRPNNTIAGALAK
jgi:hypothetical protein